MMLATRSIDGFSVDPEPIVALDTDITEVTLLLAAGQAAALERAARQHGLTVAQMTRRLIESFLHRVSAGEPAA